ncbi:MAG: M23 family metallopeptidase, partial [Clostridia bacterium]|nr:M23 family metallopeptidase [Clostridia bacterium]
MTRGKRVAPVSTRPDPRAAAARAAAMARARSVRGTVRGSREEAQPQPKPRRRKSKFLVQLVVSATVLLCVVAAKITMPDITAKYSGEVLRLMGEETDFVAAFSAAGRAIGGEEAGEAIEELCVAVFGSDAVEISTTVDRTDAVYSADTTPERVEMQQQILGFDYVCPVEGELSSSFGDRDHPMVGQERFHYGLDLSAEEGAVIRAFADGTVLAVAESTELGKYVEVVHANGY